MRRVPEQKGSAVIDAWRGARAMMGPATFGKKLHAKVSAKRAGAFARWASAIVSPRAELTRIFAQLESCLPREALVALSEGMAAARAPDSSQAVGDPRPVALGEECWSLMEILVEQLYDPDEQAPPRDPSFGRAQISRPRCARHARRPPQPRGPPYLRRWRGSRLRGRATPAWACVPATSWRWGLRYTTRSRCDSAASWRGSAIGVRKHFGRSWSAIESRGLHTNCAADPSRAGGAGQPGDGRVVRGHTVALAGACAAEFF